MLLFDNSSNNIVNNDNNNDDDEHFSIHCLKVKIYIPIGLRWVKMKLSM